MAWGYAKSCLKAVAILTSSVAVLDIPPLSDSQLTGRDLFPNGLSNMLQMRYTYRKILMHM